ncbi:MULTISPECIES: PolC-type DNA polymerase III [Roseburia]|uniref:PolC-type DNA polymerase III n=1 Tax=Roseburia TaxID=841 RepID=UPI00033B328E|nr:PolC-type DNA polymerase III [Roseburia sp. CLA-AA-H209]MCC2224850.1 PolC-type DNA polymerase III [Roseburia sp. CLA-AA-H209]CDC13934.1 dNA polymerase III polC-type [Roseburia sp. CAG:45]
MAKLFFEVFPTLKITGEMSALLKETEITKVASNSAQNALRIYLESTRLIPKPEIYHIEQEIRQQLFPHKEVAVKIIEKFNLSSQYTPEKLMAVYRESILEEIRNYSVLLYNLMRCSKMEFDREDHMILTLEDTIVATERSNELIDILEKIICERCGLKLMIESQYEKPAENNYLKSADSQIETEVAHIVARTAAARTQNTDGMEQPAIKEAEVQRNAEAAKTEKVPAVQEKNQTTGAEGTGAVPAAGKNNFSGGKDFKGKSSFQRRDFVKKSDNPDVIYGRDFEEDAIPIETIVGEMGEVVIRGQIMTLDTREIRGEKTIIIMSVTDFTDSIVLKIFTKNENLPELMGDLKKGAFLKIKGVTTIDKFDSELTIGSIVGIKKIPDFTTIRMDNSPLKRVELHCHTKMSDMDGVTDVGDLVKRAYKWGHKALAITDHGNVQAFPIANHALPDDPDFKIIYGVEAYLVDDLKDIVENSKNQSLQDTYVVFDIETTGFSPLVNKIIEIGAVKVEKGNITERFSTFVNPEVPIPFHIENLTGIKDDMVITAPVIAEVMPEFLAFCDGAVMVAHNADFDMSFIKYNCDRLSIPYDFTIADTVAMARMLLPNLNRFKLDTVARALNISLENHHRAVDDAACTAEIFEKFVKMLADRGINTLDELNAEGHVSKETVMKMPTHHAIILATNDLGRVNLYKLISLSHLDYFHQRARIPKSEYLKHKEGLLIGSACEAGELYQAILQGRPQEEIIRLVKFYDYLEIQPLGNNAFMIKDEKAPISTMDELKDINRRIVKLGEEFHKPVVATCDVHFMDPEDEVYRRIILAGKGFKDADEQAPLYLRTTEEMLEEFSYLGSEKAKEVVIDNTNMIADMCERISPVRPDKCPPVIENSDQMLRDICYNKAHEMYGEDLPEIVSERLERELKSIIGNGYAVMYIIAQKLVWKSNEDGYLVGSRGSVGSSFAATMSGITEVNPLAPHYYCAHCHYSDFDSPEVKKYGGQSGCDMPDKRCPNCGKPLVKAGFDIPFETFLGFKGNKEPDIDLNFSGDYQSKSHKYTEVIFGAGQTFRAGTIGTLADKTAFGYVKNYYEEHGVHKRNCEIDRIVQGCVGIHRTTGQHPGGIVVLPVGEEIYSFTPIQHPANDMTTDIITTHFEYHSIDHNLLKLDILGHDDPTMIRMLEDLTGIDAQKIPLDDKSVMSLFKNTSALSITPDMLTNCTLGALGIPEFGTDFAMQMLIDADPQSFSHLIRIAGLSHGTDVWLGNAQTLIEEGKATISTAICTRDDIMIYLISMGLDSEESFTIMESVRKGKGLKPEWEEEMTAHGVPDWYIWSCKKIKYMFPKAHAAAYVMMAWRIAYCKVFYPLAYYAAYFSIRATGFSYELMCQGKDKLNYFMRDYEKRKDSLSKKEQDTYKDMRIVQEMYARGYEFWTIDLYKAQASRFQIIDGKLMPALSTIDGLGEKAAEAVVEAAKDGPFLSKDDFRQRTKVSKTVIDLMGDLGLFGDLPESNQLSLFDF